MTLLTAISNGNQCLRIGLTNENPVFFFLMVTEVESLDDRSGVDSSYSDMLVELISSSPVDFSLIMRK